MGGFSGGSRGGSMGGGHRSGGNFGGNSIGGSRGMSPSMGGSRHGMGGGNNVGSSGGRINHGSNYSPGSSAPRSNASIGGPGGHHSPGGNGRGMSGSNMNGRGNHGMQLGSRHTSNAGIRDGHAVNHNHNGPNNGPNNGNWNGNHGNHGNNGNWNGNHNGNWNGNNGNWNGNHHGNNWGNNGWNGNNHHNHWNHGFWGGWGGGFYPWWGLGYGGGWGWGSRWGFGYPLLGFGLGYGGWGYPYGGYGYGGYGGYGNWGYGSSSNYYYNPYGSSPLVLGSTVIDYSQPLAQVDPAQPVVADENAPVPNDSDPATKAAMTEFDVARNAFMNGNYDAAMASVDRSIEQLPSDAVLHEFRGLVLFAQGNYKDAAAAVHAVLAGGPGWDWQTLRSLYPSVDVYTQQLRALESYASAHPDSADARFLLGYHYMTEGYRDAAIRQFTKVTQLQPDDVLAQQIVKASTTPPDPGDTGSSNANDVPLTIPQSPVTTRPSAATNAVETPPSEAPAATADAPAVNQTAAKPSVEQLAGAWNAAHQDGAKFDLNLTPEGTFTWKFTEGDKTGTLEGKYTLANDLLILEPKNGEPMVGRVTEAGADGFRFKILGAPAEDKGLKFGK
jgi:tetratricopeptide (TPR) repeat protein